MARRRRPQPAPRVVRPVMNERIRAHEVFLVDSDGTKLGVTPLAAAIAKAKEQELDLILVAPNLKPPVAKIIDYGKYIYEKKKAAQKQRSSGKALPMKGTRIGVRIGEHDFALRVKRSAEFLEKGHKVRVVLQFRGREMTHFDLALDKMKEFAARLEEVSKIETLPKKMGRQLIMILQPSKSIPKINPPQDETQVK